MITNGYKINCTYEVRDQYGNVLNDNFWLDDIIPAPSRSKAIKKAEEKIDRLKTQKYGKDAEIKRKGRMIVHFYRSSSARRNIKRKILKNREIMHKATQQPAF